MTLLRNANDIWIAQAEPEELTASAEYAAVSMPWTYNRIGKDDSARSQCSRALNTAKGLVAQKIIGRLLQSNGIIVEVQEKSYRDSDAYDIKINTHGRYISIDVKSLHHYTNFDTRSGRPPLTPQLIVNSFAQQPINWREFFPLLVTYDQRNKLRREDARFKCLCFVINTSSDVSNTTVPRQSHWVAAFPYDEFYQFLQDPQECLSREEKGEEFYLACLYNAGVSNQLGITVYGDHGEQQQIKSLTLTGGGRELIGPFSRLSSFQFSVEKPSDIVGSIDVFICDNKSSNILPRPMNLNKSVICDLIMPADYRIYAIGWMMANDFVQKAHKLDSGAGCYLFPLRWGGTKVTNYYVMPQDLIVMSELGR